MRLQCQCRLPSARARLLSVQTKLIEVPVGFKWFVDGLLDGSIAFGGEESAGASFLSEHMIAFGEEGSTPIAGMVRLAPGLGLTNRFIIDQHFRQRDRLGRLLTALAYNPFAIGIGLDEDTAAFFGPDDRLEVVGSGGITIVDPAGLAHSSMAAARSGEPVSLIGIRLHILVNGDLFDAETREARPGASTA